MTDNTIMIESPFEGGTEREADNVEYAKRCLADAFKRGEHPFVSHLIYPRLLDDTVPDQRKLGIVSGHMIAAKLGAWVFYLDRGVTPGMLEGVDAAVVAGFRPTHEPLDGASVRPPYDRIIRFRTFDADFAELRYPEGCAADIMLHSCTRWPLLIDRFQRWARKEWDLP